MSKLPFVWKLNCRGNTSYAIGTMHEVPTGTYTKRDIDPFLKGKTKLLAEAQHIPEISSFQKLLLRLGIARIRAGTDTGQGTELMDIQILSRALTFGLAPLALETPQEQADYLLLLTYSSPEDRSLFDQTVFNPSYNDTCTQAYLAGDAQKLAGLSHFSPQEQERFTLRNQRMARRSLEHITQEPCTITGGVLHFIGPKPTLLDIYQKEGTIVERVQ
ncbi:hypothetical protein C4580_02645 [Candidatus Woesearchaeota archaeon]|nr:MAG: hypothetical protein C4580_02645 [Candidatus Woesearchaeota archaeon]